MSNLLSPEAFQLYSIGAGGAFAIAILKIVFQFITRKGNGKSAYIGRANEYFLLKEEHDKNCDLKIGNIKEDISEIKSNLKEQHKEFSDFREQTIKRLDNIYNMILRRPN